MAQVMKLLSIFAPLPMPWLLLQIGLPAAWAVLAWLIFKLWAPSRWWPLAVILVVVGGWGFATIFGHLATCRFNQPCF
jgi:hypothetical protein